MTPSVVRYPCGPARDVANVATPGYIVAMTSAGIRELKDNLSHDVRRSEAGERIAVTMYGRAVAALIESDRGKN